MTDRTNLSARRLALKPGVIPPNRWFAEPEPAYSARQGERIAIEMLDGFDGQLLPESVGEDIHALDLGRSHPLSGPIWVEGAEPGDLLEIEFLHYETSSFGVTAIIPEIGLLADHFRAPYLAKWRIEDRVARSDVLPGVAIPDGTFAGVVGVAPTLDMFASWISRENQVSELAGSTPSPERGVTTVPPREAGGNIDIPQLSVGSRLYLPVACRGALVSFGDLHFAQGEGEVCGTAIEVAGVAHVRFRVIKTKDWHPSSPSYYVPARPSRPQFATTGIPVASGEIAEVRNIYAAAQNAALEMLRYLSCRCGVSEEAAYVLLSATADFHISELVNAPNCLVSALLPIDIFEAPLAVRGGLFEQRTAGQ